MPVPIPEVFKKAAESVGAGGDKFLTTEADLVFSFLHRLDEQERIDVRAYIDGLLATQSSADELLEVWDSSRTAIYFSDGEGVRRLLQDVLTAIDNYPEFFAREAKRIERLFAS